MTFLAKDERLVLILSIVAVLILVIGIYEGWWALSSMLNYIPEIILLSLIPLLLWGFRRRITGAFHNESERPQNDIVGPLEPSPDTHILERTFEVNTVLVDPIRNY